MTCLVHVELVGRPLEIRFAFLDDLCSAGDFAELVAGYISANVLVSVVIHREGRPDDYHTAEVSARPSGSGWIARILIRPACWSDAASVTVASLSLAGRPLPGDCLPYTLRVAYNHTPAPAGAVNAAAKAGDEAALQAALDAGGSTEEGGIVSKIPSVSN